jgi:hypothetical protein
MWLRLDLVCTLRKSSLWTSPAWWPGTWKQQKAEERRERHKKILETKAAGQWVDCYHSPFGIIEERFHKFTSAPSFDNIASLGAFGSVNYVNDTQTRPIGVGRTNPMPGTGSGRQVQALLDAIRREIANEKLVGKWRPEWLSAPTIGSAIPEPREPQIPSDPRFVPAKSISFRLAAENARAGIERLGERLRGAMVARLKDAGVAMREMDERIAAKTADAGLVELLKRLVA